MDTPLHSALAYATPPATVAALLEGAVRQEVAHVLRGARTAVGRAPDAERATAEFASAVERLEAVDEPAALVRALGGLERRAAARGSAELSRALSSACRRLAALEERVCWLTHGTSDSELERADPARDADRIYHRVISAFRAESRVLETLAINRVAIWQPLALFLRSTGEAEHNPVGRYFDTYALLANVFEWGLDSERGAEALRRINQIHGRYLLPNDGMKYVLLDTAFTWLDGVDRIGHRALRPLEREGFFRAHVQLGRAMHIRELSDDYAEMYRWFAGVNAANAFYTPLKRETFELFVHRSFGKADAERSALSFAARVAMDDHYRAALGYDPPTPAELDRVRRSMVELAAALRARHPRPWLRSLEPSPLRRCPVRPRELGVSERSRCLPPVTADAPNGGHPCVTAPLVHEGEAPQSHLPVYDWTEIQSHARGGSLWVVIGGEVFDVSGWAEQHPGGAAVLRQWAGRDATAAFEAAPHGALTRVLRLNYRIGRARGPEPRS